MDGELTAIAYGMKNNISEHLELLDFKTSHIE